MTTQSTQSRWLSVLDTVKAILFFQVFTVYLRYLIGGAFVISAFSLGKVKGKVNVLNALDTPSLDDLPPISQFFRVMMESGMYWQFIGWSQIIAGALLMTQRFARLGALMFFVIILNIFVITVAFHFSGTPVITGLMLLAATYLLIWDLPAFMPLIADKFQFEVTPLKLAGNPFWIQLGGVMFFSIIALGFLYPNLYLMLGIPFLEGLAGFLLYMFWYGNALTRVGGNPQ